VETFSEYQEMTSLPDHHRPLPWWSGGKSCPHPGLAAACAGSGRWRRRGDCHRRRAGAHRIYKHVEVHHQEERGGGREQTNGLGIYMYMYIVQIITNVCVSRYYNLYMYMYIVCIMSFYSNYELFWQSQGS
jgi:hypothetical protein